MKFAADWAWLTRARPKTWAGWHRLVAVWLLTIITLPIFDFLTGGRFFSGLSTLNVLVQASAVLSIWRAARPNAGWWQMALLLGLCTWCAEWVGVTTGWPFGAYAYTPALQPQLLGVPLLIPLAWLMMLPPAWAVTTALVSPQHPWRFAALSGLAFTAWDFYLDPQMVARGLWVWLQPGQYFNIPWINFGGWWLTATLLTLLALRQINRASFPRRPLALIYTLTWALQAIGLGVFWQQPGPALVGFVAMGVFVAAFWKTAWAR